MTKLMISLRRSPRTLLERDGYPGPGPGKNPEMRTGLGIQSMKFAIITADIDHAIRHRGRVAQRQFRIKTPDHLTVYSIQSIQAAGGRDEKQAVAGDDLHILRDVGLDGPVPLHPEIAPHLLCRPGTALGIGPDHRPVVFTVLSEHR